MTVYDYREITLKDDLCLEISRDTDIENPRENDCNAATFYCLKSPRRKIGDIIDSAYYLNETKRTLAKTGEYAILPIYIYEHSGIALCTVPFSDIWDSACIGFWVDEDVTCVKSMNDDYLNRQKAITEKQLSDLSSGIFLQNFDYIVYGNRLASKSENTVEFVENTIVSHKKQELDVVASGMEAMGLSVETGYYDPDDESSVDVPKQLIGFHYVVLKEKV